MTNQPETETLPMALLVQTGPLLDIYTINGKPFTGIATAYHSNLENPFDLSKLKTRTSFKQGRKDGLSEWFHKNGRLRLKENYKDGKQDGLWEYYYENGKLKHSGYFKGWQAPYWHRHPPYWHGHFVSQQSDDDFDDEIPF